MFIHTSAFRDIAQRPECEFNVEQSNYKIIQHGGMVFPGPQRKHLLGTRASHEAPSSEKQHLLRSVAPPGFLAPSVGLLLWRRAHLPMQAGIGGLSARARSRSLWFAT